MSGERKFGGLDKILHLKNDWMLQLDQIKSPAKIYLKTLTFSDRNKSEIKFPDILYTL